MTDSELLALIEHEEQNCISSTSGALAEQRRQAMQYYYGQPYGNEVEGRSQVVTTEVKDAVEGILPSLMAIFTSSDEIVRFEPENPEDEAAAQQATDYINYIFTRQNQGFLTLYCLFKDALLLKNGYAKVYWENYQDQTKETYENLSDDELGLLQQDDEVELVSLESKPDEDSIKAMAPQVAAMAAQGMDLTGLPQPQLHTAVFKRTKKYGKVCIDPTPPEEVLISRDTPNDLTKARFVEHRTKRTISKIREMGFDVPDDIADNSDAEFSMERTERLKFDDADAGRPHDGADPTTREVWLCEAFMYVDFDGDGIAEYRKITKVGSTVLDNVEFDSLPIIGGTAIPMPHKHYGLSLHDLVKDIQLIKSTITRELLNNAYVQNAGRLVVLDGMVNMDDLLNVRPNGLIRAKAMNAVTRLDNPMLGAPFYNLLEYFDKLKQNRVGATDFPNAVDPDAINAKATFVDAFRNAAMERVNLMARILAEGPVKALFLKILELVSKHQDKPQIVKLRGKWVQVDPREWHKKFNMVVTVGLGTGSQQTLLQGAMGIMGIQMEMLKAGLANRTVTEKNIFHAANKYAKAVFPKDDAVYFSDPETLPPPQPQPNIDMMKLELAKYKAELGDAQKRDKMSIDSALEQMRQKLEGETVQFKAMVDSSMKDKDHQADAAKQVLEMASQQRQLMMEKIHELRLSADENMVEKENMVLQGKIDSLLDSQKAMHDQMIEQMRLLHEAQMAEREHEVAERDQKGKIKKTVSRVKRGG